MQNFPEIPEEAPWWAYVLLALLILFILPMYRIRGEQRKQQVHQQATSVRLSRVDYQVSNEHQTNLRDDVDAIGQQASKAAEAAEQAAVAANRAATAAESQAVVTQALIELNRQTVRSIDGLRDDQKATSDRLDDSVRERGRQVREIHRRLTEHMEKREGT